MRAADKRAFIAIAVCTLAAGCFDDPAGGAHACDSCLACESCVEGPDGPTCAAASHQSQTCVGDEIRWIDSCGDDEGPAETCPAHSTCEDNGAGAATCVCTNHWQGAECDVCPGNWDAAADCAECEASYDPATGCTECLPNWSSASNCTACAGNWDVEEDCLVCESHWIDEGNDCGTCPENWDADADCDACLNHWIDEGNDCGTCPENWDADADCDACQTNWEGDDCDLCPGNWNPLANCATCWYHWIDEDNDCGTCPGNWNAAEDCVACEGNWDVATECTECLGNWDELTGCTVCLGNWDLATGCTACEPHWEGVDCETCPGNWDPAADCNACENHWIDVADDCGTCPGNWDATTDCNTCETHWEGVDCETCPGNWDPLAECDACATPWEGVDCETCHGNWDPLTECDACVGNWDELADCAACTNHWIDEGNDCGTCPGNWDPVADCDECLGAFDPTTGCTTCASGWSGTACDVQDLCVRYADVASTAVIPTGFSWANAFPRVQDGIDAAYAEVDGGSVTSCQVWVATGVYAIYESAADDTVQLRSGVQVFGGFIGTETALDERDFENNETVLDGADPLEEYHGVTHVVTGADDARLDGFTVANGVASFPSDEYHGGGMYNSGVSPVVANCSFRDNRAEGGGAVYNENSFAVFESCLFHDNRSQYQGGAISDITGGITISQCVFHNNGVSEQGGAAVMSQSSDTVIRRSTFAQNHIWGFDTTAGGAVSVQGEGQPLIEDSVFYGNLAYGPGSAVHSTSNGLSVRNCTFYKNRSNSISYNNLAGAFFVYTTSSTEVPELKNCIFWNDVPGEIAVHPSSVGAPDIQHSIVEGGYAGASNLDADPLFIDPENGDFRLNELSPAVDAADGMFASELDYLGSARFDHPGVADAVTCGVDPECVPHADLGAIEYPYGKCSGNWDPYDDCASCADLWVDVGDDCGTCPAHAIEAGGCQVCEGNWDPETGCTTCRNHWTGSDCGTCPGNWSAAVGCAQCAAGYDPATGCTACLPGWSGSACEIQDGCVRFVNLSSTAENPSGKSWSTAFATVQQGLDAAYQAALASAGTCEVWVTAGTYYIYLDSPEDTVQLRADVELYGGFLGIETEREQRDVVANETILDGGMDWTNAAQVYHVVTGSPEALIDGFTVRGGMAKGNLYDQSASYNNVGGGMIASGASVTVRNCDISNNFAVHGASFASFESSVYFENTVLRFGQSHSYDALGAGVHSEGSDLNFLNCTLTGHGVMINWESYPESIFNSDGAVIATNCIFWDESPYLDAEITNVGSGTATITYSAIWGGYAGAGNFNEDPLFDYETNGLPELDVGSPCIDAANGYAAPVTDYDGNTRIDDPTTLNTGYGDPDYADMGAFEYQP